MHLHPSAFTLVHSPSTLKLQLDAFCSVKFVAIATRQRPCFESLNRQTSAHPQFEARNLPIAKTRVLIFHVQQGSPRASSPAAMSNRKVLQEIEKCFKQVAIGVEAFDEQYDKYEQSTNASQRDKLVDSIKKECKKLQRLRDQIKTWAAGNEVKDKTQLLEKRELIETVRLISETVPGLIHPRAELTVFYRRWKLSRPWKRR